MQVTTIDHDRIEVFPLRDLLSQSILLPNFLLPRSDGFLYSFDQVEQLSCISVEGVKEGHDACDVVLVLLLGTHLAMSPIGTEQEIGYFLDYSLACGEGSVLVWARGAARPSAKRLSRQIKALGQSKRLSEGSGLSATQLASRLTSFLNSRWSSSGMVKRSLTSRRWKSFFLILEFMSILLDMLETRAGKLILAANQGWLITRQISANETTFFPSKLQRVPTQASQSRCRPTSLRCSIRGIKMFLGQFFQKARCRLPPAAPPFPTPSSTWLGISSCRQAGRKALPSSASSIREPRIKLKLFRIFMSYHFTRPSTAFLQAMPCTFGRDVVRLWSGSSWIRYKLNKIMSRQENTPNRSQQGTTNTPVSRITRTNANSNQRLISNSSLITEPAPSAEELVKLSLLPNKPSALDKNIMFQDMDHTRSSTYHSTNASQNNAPTSTPLEKEKAMGLISNVFLGSTNKFVRGGTNNAPTPIKAEQPEQPPQDTNKGTPAKFSRSKEIEQKSRTISMKEPPQEAVQATDRSMQTAKKIERRQGANRETRELKFAVEKKEQKIESTPEKVVVSARKYEATKAQAVKTEVAKPEQPVQDFTRVYQQPIQRPNPYARSRIVSEQQAPAIITTTQPARQKTKEEPVLPAKPVNRLVQSRLQNQLSESKVSEKQFKPATTLNRGSESRLVVEVVVTEPVVQKQQVKPKPYSRSFINQKPEPQPQASNHQSVINQSAIKQSPKQPSRVALQQSKIIEIKAKPQEKQVIPEASDVKVILKKSGCIALICKRLIRSRLKEGFALLKNHRKADKAKKTNECQIVCCSLTTIVRAKETNLLKVGFEAMKRKFSTAYIMSLKSYADEAPTNHKNAGVILLDYLYCSKMKTNFKVFKTLLERFRNRAKCVVVIESFYKQKVKNHMKRSFENIKMRQKTNILALNNLSNVFNNANKIKLSSAFLKIAGVKPTITKSQTYPVKQQTPQRSRIVSKAQQPAPVVNDISNQALIEKLDKLKKFASTVQGEITSIQSSIAKKKKTNENEKSSLLEKVTVLKHQNWQVNNQIQIKKHRSWQIKQEMGTIPKKHRQLQEELTEPPQNKLELLTNIYISHFKNTEETIATADLQNAYNLKVEDGSVLFHEWASILKNVQLKRIIAAYQGVDPGDNKGRTNLISEQTLVSKLIRSYVKQQYFWQWIHLSAQNA